MAWGPWLSGGRRAHPMPLSWVASQLYLGRVRQEGGRLYSSRTRASTSLDSHPSSNRISQNIPSTHLSHNESRTLRSFKRPIFWSWIKEWQHRRQAEAPFQPGQVCICRITLDRIHRANVCTISLRSSGQPDLSKKLYKIIKTEGATIAAYETAGRERASIASQLSDWGDETGDDAISDLSDKLGVLLSEIAEQEDMFAANLEESRNVLKVIRNTERSVQPTRDSKVKISDEIQKLKYVYHNTLECAMLLPLLAKPQHSCDMLA